MKANDPTEVTLEQGMALSGMNLDELWLRQISVGGTVGDLELEAYVLGVLRPDAYQHNIIAQALNEHFMDHGGNHRVACDDSDTADL